MKKAISLIPALILVFCLQGCRSAAVKNAEALIESIGAVTTRSGSAIASAEAAYAALNDEEKAEVVNRDILINAKAEYVEAMIAALGEITTQSEDAVIAAEEAYAALSGEEQSAVENRDALTAARTALEAAKFEAFRLSFTGEWVRLTEGAEAFITLNADGTGKILEYDAAWSLNGSGDTLNFKGAGVAFDFMVGGIADTHTIYCADLGTMLVKKDDYPKIKDTYFTAVEISPENLSDYVGQLTHIRNIPDDQGAEGAGNLFAFRSNAYADGLVFVGAGDDFSLEYSYIINPRRGVVHHGKTANPFYAIEEQIADPAGITIENASGTLLFIKAELVAELTYDQAGRTRVITLTDGAVIYDRCMVYSAESCAYDYLTETDLTF